MRDTSLLLTFSLCPDQSFALREVINPGVIFSYSVVPRPPVLHSGHTTLRLRLSHPRKSQSLLSPSFLTGRCISDELCTCHRLPVSVVMFCRFCCTLPLMSLAQLLRRRGTSTTSSPPFFPYNCSSSVSPTRPLDLQPVIPSFPGAGRSRLCGHPKLLCGLHTLHTCIPIE